MYETNFPILGTFKYTMLYFFFFLGKETGELGVEGTEVEGVRKEDSPSKMGRGMYFHFLKCI